MNLRNRQWMEDPAPIDPNCPCTACRGFSRGVLRHLCTTNEMLGPMLLTLHNLTYFHGLIGRIRSAIITGGLRELRARELATLE